MANNKLLRWDITKSCNLNCKHCISAHMYDDIEELSKEQKIALISKVAKEGVSRIHLLGGEPMTVPYIDEIVETCAANNISLSLNTNGYRLCSDTEICELFAKHNVGISFSIDGISAESHDKIRGKGSYEKILKAAENYGKVIKNYNHPIISAFYFTLTPDNVNDNLEQLLILAHQLNINHIVLGVLISKGNGAKNYQSSDITMEKLISKTEELAVLSKQFPDINISFPYQTPLLLKYLNDKHNLSYKLCYSKCKSGKTDFQLRIDGTLSPCIYVDDSLKFRNSPLLSRNNNNLLHQSFNAITGNQFYTEFKDFMDNKKNTECITPCNQCPYNTRLGICGPCALQTQSDLDFHKHKLCAHLLEINGNNFYA